MRGLWWEIFSTFGVREGWFLIISVLGPIIHLTISYLCFTRPIIHSSQISDSEPNQVLKILENRKRGGEAAGWHITLAFGGEGSVPYNPLFSVTLTPNFRLLAPLLQKYKLEIFTNGGMSTPQYAHYANKEHISTHLEKIEFFENLLNNVCSTNNSTSINLTDFSVKIINSLVVKKRTCPKQYSYFRATTFNKTRQWFVMPLRH